MKTKKKPQDLTLRNARAVDNKIDKLHKLVAKELKAINKKLDVLSPTKA